MRPAEDHRRMRLESSVGREAAKLRAPARAQIAAAVVAAFATCRSTVERREAMLEKQVAMPEDYDAAFKIEPIPVSVTVHQRCHRELPQSGATRSTAAVLH